jgi:tRNA-dihydrouridine synthase B
MRIKNLTLKNNLILAPMASVNCLAFRLLCKKYEAGLVSTPMMFADEIVNDFEKTKRIVEFNKEEQPILSQIVGNKGNIMKEATQKIEDFSDIIDINLGCPEKKVLGQRAGSFFMKHPEQIRKILTPVLDSTNKPVSVKIRTGWDEHNTKEILKHLIDQDISMITIHGRTKKQLYSGKSNLDEIKKANEFVKKTNDKIKVICNGDGLKPGSCKFNLDYTKTDGIMIARGAIGNPFIFKRTNELLKKGSNNFEPSTQDRIDALNEFYELYSKQKRQKINEVRDHTLWTLKRINNSIRIKRDILNAETIDDMQFIINEKLGEKEW